MRSFLSFLAIVLVCFGLLSFAARQKPRDKYLGQRCPPDMEFIAGNENMPSFFIGKSEETNLDYAIYMQWLKSVYVDYPAVLANTTPHELNAGELSKFNDPYLKDQLYNPAYAYYPVTGCDWYQVQDYLAWKTDRINEEIMIRDGYFKFNPQQANSDNYNLEAQMAGEYEGLTKHMEMAQFIDEPFLKGHGWQMVKVFPYLLTGLRLPTEEEWEYAAQSTFANSKTVLKNPRPFGKFYYLLRYAYNPNGGRGRDLGLIGYARKAGQAESSDLNRIKGSTTYDNRQYGIYNMGNNVEEWMLDEYSPALKHYPNLESVYTSNGFRIASDSDYRMENGDIIIKDSMGRMPYRIMGFRSNGDELKVLRYQGKRRERYVYEKIRNPDSLRIKAAQTEMVNERVTELERSSESVYKQYGDYRGNNPFALYSYGKLIPENLAYYRLVHKLDANGKEKDTLVLDRNLILNSKKFVDERDYKIVYRFVKPAPNDTLTGYRVVKTGNWKTPSTTSRKKMKETDASPDVGFRAVMQYNGMPIRRDQMVHW